MQKEELKENLYELYKKGSLSHAILLNGENEADLNYLAEFTAENIIETNTLSHPDLSIYENFDGKQYNIDNIRTLRDSAFTAPIAAKSKVYIIKNLETMPILSQNALLKIIEEPPENVVFIFTSASLGTILSTIISRVAIFNLDSKNALVETERGKEALNLILGKKEFKLINLLSNVKQREELDKFFDEIYSTILLHSKESPLRYATLLDIIKEAKVTLKKNVNISDLIVVFSHKLIKE